MSNTALEKAPDAYAIYSNIATVYFKQRKFNKSVTALTLAIEKSPENGEYYHNRGISFLRLDKMENACADFNKAVQLGYQQARSQIERHCKK